jgi:hypothetical protein
MAQQLRLTNQHNIEEVWLPDEYIGIKVYTRSDRMVPPFNVTRCIENDVGLDCPGSMWCLMHRTDRRFARSFRRLEISANDVLTKQLRLNR